ncbi:hypothetical protein M9458_055539 [Cirrhinus mrigala]|uniref:Uncharacterized protein n=1 Tax=Cirrhinus mrigala TaxID=683832 RepID=A0ABD0MJA1_CIRMR
MARMGHSHVKARSASFWGLTGKGVLEETPGPSVCQPVPADSTQTGRSWQREDLKEARLRLNPQVYLSFAESTPDELDRLGLESPFLGRVQLNSLNNVNGAQRFELRQTPEEEMAGKFQYATAA